MKKLTNKNPFKRKAQKLFLKAWKHFDKGIKDFEQGFLYQVISQRKSDKKKGKK